MIIKRNFNPRKVVTYVWLDLSLALIVSLLAFLLYIFGVSAVALPFAPIGVLGTALAIFLAFRTNTSYARWLEAAQLWYSVQATSRVFARLVLTFVAAHQHTPQHKPEEASTFQREIIFRHLAWLNALRLQLRGQSEWHTLNPFLSQQDYQTLEVKHNKANYLLKQQGNHIYEAMAKGILQGFDSFQLEGCLLQLSNQQAACERLKAIPIPRQYDYFTRVFLRVFIVLLPFFLLSVLTTLPWLVIPLTLTLAFIYAMLERIGVVNENPFENQITDVPLTAICIQTERDIRELLDDAELPPPAEVKDGYLF
jgi:putative membrane protein